MTEPVETTLSAIERGEQLFAEGKIAAAVASFEEALQERPDDPQIYNNLGVIAHQSGQAAQAVVLFTKAMTIDPDFEPAADNVLDMFGSIPITDLKQSIESAFAVLLAGVSREKIDEQHLELLKDVVNSLQQDQAEFLLQQALRKSPERTSAFLLSLLRSKLELNPTILTDLQDWLKKDDIESAGTKDIRLTIEIRTADIPKIRVLHGSYEIANQGYTITRAMARLGMEAETACYYPNYLRFKSDHALDLSQYASRQEAVVASREMATRLIADFDLFHFHFGCTLALDFSDLPIIQEQGKRMVPQFWGSEVRTLSRARELNPYAKVKHQDEDSIKRTLTRLAAYMPHCIVSDFELFEYVKDYFSCVHVIPTVIDLAQYHPKQIIKNDRFTIVHAPTSPSEKGTPFVLKAIEQLKSEYEFEFKLISGMSHEDAMEHYAAADLIVDQLHIGSYGLLSVEAMAIGKPVITWISDYMRDKYPKEIPIISANPDTIKGKIEFALENREEIQNLGNKGRAYVERYHDANKNVRDVIEVYKQL